VAVGEESSAETGAQGEHQFHALALDGSIAGDIGVVAHADWASLQRFASSACSGNSFDHNGCRVDGPA
jgi:hypothetical protein